MVDHENAEIMGEIGISIVRMGSVVVPETSAVLVKVLSTTVIVTITTATVLDGVVNHSERVKMVEGNLEISVAGNSIFMVKQSGSSG